MSAAPSLRSLLVTPGGCWKWSMPVTCSALSILDCGMVLHAEVCCGYTTGFPQPGYVPTRWEREKEEWDGMRSNNHPWKNGSFALSLALRISSKQPMAQEQAVSPLTSVAPTLALNTASSSGLDSADAGALPRCERRGCELPSRLLVPSLLLPREVSALFVSSRPRCILVL